MGVSQNNIRNNQNFEICATICRPGSTISIKSKAEPGGSTLSRSIFAFLENRDNTNVDSNFHESQKFGPRKFLKLAQCLPKPPGFFGYLAASPDRARDGWGTCEEPLVHLEGVRPLVVQQLSLNDP